MNKNEKKKKKGRPRKSTFGRDEGGKFSGDSKTSKDDIRTGTAHDSVEKVLPPPVRLEEKMISNRTGEETKEQTRNMPTPSPQPTHPKDKEDEKKAKINPTHIDFAVLDEVSEDDEDDSVKGSILPEVWSDSDIDSDSSSNSDEEENDEEKTFHGNRILPFESLTSIIRNKLSCQFCYEDNIETELNDFLHFLIDEKLMSPNEDSKRKIVSEYMTKNRNEI